MEREGLPPAIKYHSNAVITGAGRRVNSAFGGLSILGDFIDLAVRKRPARGRAGKRRSSTADRRLQTEAKASRLARRDRWFWIALSVAWKDWRRALCIVQPDTVVGWQRECFHWFWANLSKRSATAGRPPVSPEVRTLIRTLAQSTPLWRAPRIHGELQKLGIEVSERTLSRLLRTIRRPPAQTWKTFLRNHISDIVAIDFFTVPTVRLRVLFVFLVIEPQRRKVLHFGVTEHPTAEWASQQVVEAFSERDAKR
jgi:putative transposase